MAVALQRALFAGVRLFGSGVIPGDRVAWMAPAPREQWEALVSAWTAETGGFDQIALYHRPQPGRIGFAALLLRDGRGVAFARVHPDEARVAHEFSVLSHLHAAGPTTFGVARPIAVGRIPDASWVLTTSVPNYPLGAVRRASTRERVAAELSEILSERFQRPPGTPDHWVVAHGDFTPWNLRTDRGGVIVLDWEDTEFAPPGTDLLYGALTAHTTFGSSLPSSAPLEAAVAIEEVLIQRIARQGSGSGESRLLQALATIPKV
jgi:hypothetical protein